MPLPPAAMLSFQTTPQFGSRSFLLLSSLFISIENAFYSTNVLLFPVVVVPVAKQTILKLKPRLAARIPQLFNRYVRYLQILIGIRSQSQKELPRVARLGLLYTA